MAHVQYSSQSLEDIESVAAYIADRAPQAARRFLRSVRDTVNRLLEFPALGAIYAHPDHSGLRAKLVITFRNYVVFYTVSGGNIYIIRVLHTARDIHDVLGD